MTTSPYICKTCGKPKGYRSKANHSKCHITLPKPYSKQSSAKRAKGTEEFIVRIIGREG